MTTPMASKTTVSSRNKMAAGLGNHFHPSTTAKTAFGNNRNATETSATSRIPPRTAFKPPLTKTEQTTAKLAATSSRIALARSRLSGSSTAAPVAAVAPTTTTTSTITSRLLATTTGLKGRRFGEAPPAANALNHRLPSATTSTLLNNRHTSNVLSSQSRTNSFANSRSSSKLSSTSSSANTSSNNNNNNNNNNAVKLNGNYERSSSRQSPLASNTQATSQKSRNPAFSSTIPSSNYIPDTNAIRKGLAKFSNPMECQRQFQTLNSKLRQLTDISENKEKKIGELQEQLNGALKQGVGYAMTVQYLAMKLKIHDSIDLEKECELLKSRVESLLKHEQEFNEKLEAISAEYEVKLVTERTLRDAFCNQLDETRIDHAQELTKLKDSHERHSSKLENKHQLVEQELNARIEALESDLITRTKELHELKKDYDNLNASFNKLEESLTKDKDARVKYAQEKSNQLQKDVDSLNSVLEMRNERIHALEKDSILLGEVQDNLMRSEDNNKALKQQLESMTAALENKRVQYENLLADQEKIAQELKRERKERRRMTMRTEQLEYVLNESCCENNISHLDSSVETS